MSEITFHIKVFCFNSNVAQQNNICNSLCQLFRFLPKFASTRIYISNFRAKIKKEPFRHKTETEEGYRESKINSYGQKLKADLAVVVFLFGWGFFYTAFLFEGTQTGGVGYFIEVIQTLADGSEITRCQIFDGFQSPAFGSG